MKKNILYGLFALSLATVGLTSCDPQDNDDHSLGGEVIAQEVLSLTVTEGEQNVFTLTNSSKEIDGVRYFLSADGKKLVDAPVGSSITAQFKKKGTYNVYLYAFTACDQKVVAHTIKIEANLAEPEVFGWGGFTAGTNLMANSKATHRFWFTGPDDWNGMADPDNSGNINDGIQFTMNGAGSDQWKAQLQIEKTGVSLSAGKTYDFSIAIVSDADKTLEVTVKPQKDGDDNTFFSADKHKVKKGMNVIAFTDCAGFDGDFKIALDFAGAPEGTGFTVKNVFLSEHNNANVVPLDYDDAANIWRTNVEANKAYEMDFWWSDASWQQIGNPDFEVDNNVYIITAKDATAAEWQAQNTFKAKGFSFGADELFDMSCVVKADQDCRVTVKFCEMSNDDNAAFYVNDINLKAGESRAVKFEDVKFGAAAADTKLIFDLGGCKAGTEFKVGKITFIKK